MNKLSEKDQDQLLKFVRFFKTYNPQYRMAPGMALQFEQLRKETLPIVDKAYSGD